MSDTTAVTEILPHDQVLLVNVLARSLNETTTEQLVDDVLCAASERIGIPIAIDMTRVKFAPSVALGALVRLTKSFTFENRRIAIIGADRRVREVINVTRLDKLLELHDKLEGLTSRLG